MYIYGTKTDASYSTNLNNRTSILNQPEFVSPVPPLCDETFDKAHMSTNGKTNSNWSMRRKRDRRVPNTDAGGTIIVSIYQDTIGESEHDDIRTDGTETHPYPRYGREGTQEDIHHSPKRTTKMKTE